jgi:preprotein translocase subunit SecG
VRGHGARAVRLVRVVIWLATAFFIVMLFAPLVEEMRARLAPAADVGLP